MVVTFALNIDAARWREHIASVRDRVRGSVTGSGPVDGDLVPVIKGNGYGLGNDNLVIEAARAGLSRIAVGTVFEATRLLPLTEADVLVLTPFDPRDTATRRAWEDVAAGPHRNRLIRTVADPRAWQALAEGPGPVRVVLEGLTSMGRFGMTAEAIAELLSADETMDVLITGQLTVEGLALHLPLAQPSMDHRSVPGARWHDALVAPVAPAHLSARGAEAWAWGLGWQVILADVSERLYSSPNGESERAITSLTSAAALWVSHLSDDELRALREALPDIELFARIGTRLWLGDRQALRATGTVLAVNPTVKGMTVGYRQRRSPKDGSILVIGGGTAHGVALAAPSSLTSFRQRAVALGTGVLESVGRSLSPFVIGGSQRWFVEPPHMQVSLIHIPRGVSVPAVGDEVDVEIRMTTAQFDVIRGLHEG
jgi:hypothetical protein